MAKPAEDALAAGRPVGAPHPRNSGPLKVRDTSGALGPPAALPGAPPRRTNSGAFPKPPSERLAPKPGDVARPTPERIAPPSSGELLKASGTRLPASTVVRPIGGRPGSTSTRISLGSRGAPGTSHWSCTSCQAALPIDALVKGLAELKDGKLLCSHCTGKDAKKKEKPRPFGWGLVGGVAAVFAVVSLILPGQAAFILLLGCVVAVVVGGASFQMRSTLRAGLVCGGLIGIGACIFALTAIQHNREDAQARSELDSAVNEIEGHLKNDRINDAQARFMALERYSKNPQGQYKSPEIASRIKAIGRQFEEWYKNRYGDLGEQDREVLALLLKAVPEGGVEGVLRYRKVKLDDKRLALGVAIAGEGSGVQLQRSIADKAKPVLLALGLYLRNIETLELTLGASEDLADAKTYTLERAQFQDLANTDLSTLLNLAPSEPSK